MAAYVMDTVVFVRTFGSPSSHLVVCSLRRDREDLFFFDFVAELLECGVVNGHAIRQSFSPLLLSKLIDPITINLCLLLFMNLTSSNDPPLSFMSMFDHCVSTLVLCGPNCSTSRENPRYYALLTYFA